MSIVDSWDLRTLPKNPENLPAVEEQFIMLTEKFYETLMKNKVPYNLETVRALKASPYDLYLYFYLNYQSFVTFQYLGGQFFVKYWGSGGLKERLGTNLSRIHFRKRVSDSIKRIQKVWNNCPVIVSDNNNSLIIKIDDIDQLDVKIDALKFAGKKIREAGITLTKKQIDVISNYAPNEIYEDYKINGGTKEVLAWLNKNLEEWRLRKKAKEEKSKLTPRIKHLEKKIEDLWEIINNQGKIANSSEREAVVSKTRIQINMDQSDLDALKRQRNEEIKAEKLNKNSEEEKESEPERNIE